MTSPVPVSAEPAQPRSRSKVVAGIVGVAALVGAGVFAVSQVGGGGSDGGADSPEQAVEQLIGAIAEEDVLGAMEMLLPGERETYRQPLVDLVEELSRLSVLADGANLGDVAGLDIVVDNLSIDVDETDVDDIVNTTVDGEVTVVVDGEQVPIGDLLIDEAFGGERPDMDVEETTDQLDDLPLTTVERDGRWFVSVMYTVAETARQDTGADVPARDAGIEPAGAESPEEALRALVEAIADLDLEAMIATLDPEEAEVLQRYAPLFLDDAQAQLDDLDVEVTVDELEISEEEVNGSTTASIDSLDATVEADGQRATISVADGCTTVEVDGESMDSCDGNAGAAIEDVLGEVPEELTDALETIEAAFADLETGGITVDEVDGEWFVSPVGTLADQLLNVLRALDAAELSDVIDAVRSAVEGFDPTDIVIDESITIEGLPELDDGGELDVPFDTTPPETVPFDTAPVDDALTACYQILEGPEGVACVLDGVAAGTIDPAVVNPAYLHPECGVAELTWTYEYYTLPDDQFDSVVAAAAQCFAPLLASGQVDEFLLAPELAHPECLPGGNVYANDRSADYDALLACAYS